MKFPPWGVWIFSGTTQFIIIYIPSAGSQFIRVFKAAIATSFLAIFFVELFFGPKVVSPTVTWAWYNPGYMH